jgi:hypothetical protein
VCCAHSALTHHGKPLKISRRSQFSHIVPRKQSQWSLRGAWLIWVRPLSERPVLLVLLLVRYEMCACVVTTTL